MANRAALTLSFLALVGCYSPVLAQDRLKTMPRYDRYERLRREIGASYISGEVRGRWSEDGKKFGYTVDGKKLVYNLTTNKVEEGEIPAPPPSGDGGRSRRNPDRGRQYETAFSADGTMKAVTRDRNVYVSNADGGREVAVTTDGSVAKRLKYGIASWVYGEELEVREAMWWSPDGKKLAYYRFDESKVPDYYLAFSQGKIQDTLDVEAYPKAGAPNPEVALFVYDLDSKQSTKIDTTFDGGAGSDVGHYVYAVRWSPEGNELLFNRTNRKQNTMEFCASNPSTGACRVIIREQQPKSWADNSPTIRYLNDTKSPRKFFWISERNGFKNLFLYDLSGKLISTVTDDHFDAENIVQVDEKKKLVYYTCRSADNPYLLQLHRTKFDGTENKRLTDPAFSHSVDLSPDGKAFVDVQQTLDTPPVTVIRDVSGKKLVQIGKSDLTKFDQMGLRKTERITYMAADGRTTLYGTLQYPSDFNPNKQYPLVVSVYGGPESGGGIERFRTPDPITELGFLVATFDNRGTSGRGKAFKDTMYKKMGIVEIDDQAAGVKALTTRSYVDGNHVGIYGTSYGGYSSVMAILRYPDIFRAACASSAVTDWRNYDSIYTERYNSLPQDNESGYADGSAMNYVRDLKGKLMLYYGTADNNVHPANTLQLVVALERAGKSYDMQVGPDRGHTAMNFNRQWEYFIDNLILDHTMNPLAKAWNQREYRRKVARKLNGSSNATSVP